VDGAPAKVLRASKPGGRLMVRLPEGIWWIPATGWVWLTTTKGAPGDWARDLSWTAIKWGGRSAAAGAAYTARSTWSRLLVPLALSAPVQTAAIITAPIVVAAVVAGVHTAALQKTGIIGPDAPVATSPFSFDGEKSTFNPFTMGWGTVV